VPLRIALHAAIGALAGLGFALALVALDVAALRSLALRAEGGMIGLALLAAAHAAGFAALAVGSGLFLPAGGTPRRERRARPLAAAIAACPRDRRRC
jgi:hypothetical protein